MIQLNERRAYKEVVTIINNMDASYKNRIPPKLFSFFETNSDSNYQFNINGAISLKEQGLMDETKSLLALINLKYWCDSEEKKQSLLKVYTENERNYLKAKEEQFPTDVFGNNTNTEDSNNPETTKEENLGMIKYENERWYQKFFRKIIGLFKAKSHA